MSDNNERDLHVVSEKFLLNEIDIFNKILFYQ